MGWVGVRQSRDWAGQESLSSDSVEVLRGPGGARTVVQGQRPLPSRLLEFCRRRARANEEGTR